VRLAADGSGIALLRFEGRFDYPSVVVHLDWKTGASKVVYRQKDRVVTDLAVVDGGAVLAAVEPPGSLANTPVPGKLRMLRGSRLTSWKEMKVDYRAAARRAVLASQGSDLWVATDTGMILKLESH
jgi:hypothetical protein